MRGGGAEATLDSYSVIVKSYRGKYILIMGVRSWGRKKEEEEIERGGWMLMRM